MSNGAGAKIANENMYRRGIETKLDKIIKLLEKLLEKEDEVQK